MTNGPNDVINKDMMFRWFVVMYLSPKKTLPHFEREDDRSNLSTIEMLGFVGPICFFWAWHGVTPIIWERSKKIIFNLLIPPKNCKSSLDLKKRLLWCLDGDFMSHRPRWWIFHYHTWIPRKHPCSWRAVRGGPSSPATSVPRPRAPLRARRCAWGRSCCGSSTSRRWWERWKEGWKMGKLEEIWSLVVREKKYRNSIYEYKCIYVSIYMYTNIISHECRLDYMLAVFSSHISLLVKYSSSVCPNHSIRPLSLPVASYLDTPCKIHMEPKNGALEDDFPFQLADLLGSSRQFSRCISFFKLRERIRLFPLEKSISILPPGFRCFSLCVFLCVPIPQQESTIRWVIMTTSTPLRTKRLKRVNPKSLVFHSEISPIFSTTGIIRVPILGGWNNANRWSFFFGILL